MVLGTADPAWGVSGVPGGTGPEGHPQVSPYFLPGASAQLWEVLWEVLVGESWERCREMWGSPTCVVQGGPFLESEDKWIEPGQ